MINNKKLILLSCFFLGLILILNDNNFQLDSQENNNSKNNYYDNYLTRSSNSILFDNFYYRWYARINNNPNAYYNGIENYTQIGNNLFHCNETLIYRTYPPTYDYRDVNNLTRFFPTSSSWGNNKHDWVWIFKNTTINTKNIPIAIFEGGVPEAEHLFNVTGESIVNLGGNYYNVWVLKDSVGSIANYEKNTGILINGTFIFASTQKWVIKMTETNAEILSNSNPPLLEDPEITPLNGNLTTFFKFSINYSDTDNNIPTKTNVIINETEHPMIKEDSGDTDYTDGVIYEYQTFLSNGTYNYYFNASDGPHSTWTSTFFGPIVYYNNSYAPSLSDFSVYPLLGFNSSTQFLYRVNYTDKDNNAPSFVKVTINGTTFTMQRENALDSNYMDGTFFRRTIILNETGYYIFNFTCSDGKNIVKLPTSGFYYNPNVTRHDLRNIDIGWIISHGEQSNSTYSTFLSDAINLEASSKEFDKNIEPDLIYPYEILILEEGGNAWKDYELNNLRFWVENGGSLIVIGDNRNSAQTSVSNFFNVSYSSQGGISGTSTQIYQPHYLTVLIDSLLFGTQTASIDKDNSRSDLQLIANSSNGYPQVALLQLGAGKILWIVDEIIENSQITNGDNREFGLNVLRWLSKDKINNFIPALSNPNFAPSSGNITTFFTFSVNYTDKDNRGPLFLNVTIDNKQYQMEKQNQNDFNYADGVIFEYITTLQNGTQNYNFNASDGTNNISTTKMTTPFVVYINNYNPQLFYGCVSPDPGYEHQTFIYNVNYTDHDNNPPKYVNVTIDGIPHQMSKVNPFDDYFIDGVLYEYKSFLNIGSHIYWFNTSDNERKNSTQIYTGPMVNQSPLKNVKIAWIQTHGENSNSTYTKILNNARDMGASIVTFQTTINDTSIHGFDIIVVNEGGSSWTSNELNTLENWIINGCSVLILGDNRDAAQVSVSSKFKLYYSSQSGSSGNSTLIFSPHNVTKNISKVYFPFPSSSISSSSNMYISPLVKDTNGKLIIASLQYGSGKLLWVVDESFSNSYLNYADNNKLSNNSWIWLADTSPNINAPNIINVNVNPASGNSRTIFNFYLNYSDSDGSAPIYVSITINNTKYQMIKQNASDFNFNDGMLYNYSLQLAPGIYNYFFNVTDGRFNASYPIGYLTLLVASINLESPTFTSTSVTPYLAFGNPSTIIFQANYQDIDNTPPVFIQVFIDDVPYDMTKLEPSDTSYYNGVIYQHEAILYHGKHQYFFKAYDGFYTINIPLSGKNLGPIVVEEKPLDAKRIGWIESHGENNYYSYTIYLNDAVALGGTFGSVTGTINDVVLSNYDIIIVGEGGNSWTGGELTALDNWVSNGGILFVIGDNRDNSMVSVSNKFQVYYKAYSDSIDYTSNIEHPHTLTNGVNQLYTYPYTSIDESISSASLQKLVRDKNGELIVATLFYDNGKITWICDDDIVRNVYINNVDNRLFTNNTWIWAVEPISNSDKTGDDDEEEIGKNKALDNIIGYIILIISIIGVVGAGISVYILKRKKQSTLLFTKKLDKKVIKEKDKSL